MKVQKKKTVMLIAVIVSLNIFALALSQYAEADLYKKGASGSMVREIQTRLKAWGYYSGSVDGMYGSQTEKAVRYFQKSNGLSVDGQVGNRTLAALGLPTGVNSSSSGSGGGDVDLLARLISAEARGEPS